MYEATESRKLLLQFELLSRWRHSDRHGLQALDGDDGPLLYPACLVFAQTSTSYFLLLLLVD